MTPRRFAMLALAWFLPTVAYGATWYCAPSTASPPGLVGNAGTIGSPWDCTRACSASVIQPFDTVLLRGGNYWDTLGHWIGTDYGREVIWKAFKSDLTYKAYPGEIPILHGPLLPSETKGAEVFKVNTNTVLDSLWFEGGGHYGIQAIQSGVVIKNCHFDNIPAAGCSEGGNCGCISANSEDQYMTNWTIKGNYFGPNVRGRAAIQAYGMIGTKIDSNYFNRSFAGGSWNALFLKVGSSTNHDNEWSRNSFVNCGWGIYNEGEVYNMFIHNNVVMDSGNGHVPFLSWYGSIDNVSTHFYRFYVYNNTFIGGGSGWNLVNQKGTSSANMTLDHFFIFNNIFYRAGDGVNIQFRNNDQNCNNAPFGDSLVMDYNFYGPANTAYRIFSWHTSSDCNWYPNGTWAAVTLAQWQAGNTYAWNATYTRDPHSIVSTAVPFKSTSDFGLNPAGTNYTFLSTSGAGARIPGTPPGGGSWPTYIGALAPSRVYFVRTTGSDANDGRSWATAWATNAKVQSTVVAGDTVLYGAGFYFNTNMNLPAGGGPSTWTVYACSSWYAGATDAEKVAGANKPVWSGGTLITGGWTDMGGGIFRAAYTPSNCDQYASGYPWAVTRGGVADMEMCTSRGATYTNCVNALDYAYSGGFLYYHPPAAHPNPSVDTIIAACNFTVELNAANINHTRIWGIGLRNAFAKCWILEQEASASNCDTNYVEHCSIGFVGGGIDGNESCVGSNASNDPGTPLLSEGNVIRACSLSNSWELDQGAGTKTIWEGANWYHVGRTVVESCYFAPTTTGIFWKDSTQNCTARFNYFDHCSTPSSRALNGYYAGPRNDSCYGNIFDGVRTIQLGNTETVTGDTVYFWNNTIYNSQSAFLADEHGLGAGGFSVKFNVFYITNNGSNEWVIFPTGYGWTRDGLNCDSNVWYDSPVTNFTVPVRSAYSTANWAGWQAYGNDVAGKFQDPLLANPSIRDFSRPSASAEMSRTYGGKTWTIWGAIQPSAAADAVILPTLPLRKR